MAKRTIKKTEQADTTAPKRRRTTASADLATTPAVKAAPRSRRKAATEAPAETSAALEGTNGNGETTAEVSQEQIAVRAYHIYLERGYAGDSFHDWVTAERELREQIARARG
jgi:hypothetical protein